MQKRYRLLVQNPGHFHAALLFKESGSRIEDEVDVITPYEPDTNAFRDLIEDFNQREERPTNWKLNFHQRVDELLTSDESSDQGVPRVAILSGRNNTKLSDIAELAQQGVHVLADKPWLTHSDQIELLDRALSGPGQVMDIMTIRHEILSRLCRSITEREELFGKFVNDDKPAVEVASIHHLYKKVNGEPVRRPPWYFDTEIQGNGIVDIQSHMIEQAMWFVIGDRGIDEEALMQLRQARSWSTAVPQSLYAKSTGKTNFPEGVKDAVDRKGVLHLECNSEIDWSIGDTLIRSRAEWRQEEPSGAGDLHRVVLRGTGCEIEVTQDADTNFQPRVELRSLNETDSARAELFERVHLACEAWSDRFPGLGFSEIKSGLLLLIPRGLDEGHESHFPIVREQFLDYLDTDGIPRDITNRIRARYRLLGEAYERAKENRLTGCDPELGHSVPDNGQNHNRPDYDFESQRTPGATDAS